MSCLCIYSISFYFCHNKLTRQILYVVIYFFCNVFLTIQFVISYNICSLPPFVFRCVRVCPQVLNLSKLPVYYCIKISYRKFQIMKFFLCCVFYSTKNISKTCIAFCWYCFGWDTAKARHRYANNIDMLITESTIECSSFCDYVNLPWTIRDTSKVFDTCAEQVSFAPAL
jgi:hypothetical protein